MGPPLVWGRFRIEVIKRRAAFEKDPVAFAAQWKDETDALRAAIEKAMALHRQVEASDEILLSIAERSLALGVDGHRSDIIMLKAAKGHCHVAMR